MKEKKYEKPVVTTYSEQEIMQIIGPAQTVITGGDGQLA
jgi:hypothetical protein